MLKAIVRHRTPLLVHTTLGSVTHPKKVLFASQSVQSIRRKFVSQQTLGRLQMHGGRTLKFGYAATVGRALANRTEHAIVYKHSRALIKMDLSNGRF